MKVLLASDFYPPFTGGSELQVEMLGQELAQRGHAVCVATVWHKGLQEHERQSGVTVYRLRGLTTSIPFFFRDPGVRRFHPPFPDPGLTSELRRIVAMARPDVVHATGCIAYSCAAALLGTEIPLVVTARDYSYSCAARTLVRNHKVCDGPRLGKCIRCASKTYGLPKAVAAVSGVYGFRGLLTSRVSAFHAASTFVGRILERDLLGRSGWGGADRRQGPTIIPNMLRPDADGSCGHEVAELVSAKPYILYVGALRPHKGVDVLLEAYGRLEVPPNLVLAGTTWPDTPSEFPKGVRVLREVSHEYVMEAWKEALFGVIPSRWPEPFGNVIIEAMAKGKAVIATNLAGPVDIVVDGSTGVLVPPDDVGALAAAMQRLIADVALRQRLEIAARERAALYYADRVVPQLEKLYRRVVGEDGG